MPKNRGTKRKNPTDKQLSNQTLPPTKKSKNNNKQSVNQRTTLQEVHDFLSKTESNFKQATFTPYSITLLAKVDNTSHDIFNSRHVIFDAISNHFFPIISQRKHYFRTLTSLKISIWFNRFDKKEMEFINQCFSTFSTLPYLRKLHFEFHSLLNGDISERHKVFGSLFWFSPHFRIVLWTVHSTCTELTIALPLTMTPPQRSLIPSKTLLWN